jgi:heptosyltransferase I
MRQICIVRLSALGDCLHVLALIASLKKEGGCAITWVIAKPFAPLFQHIKDVRFIIINKPRGVKDYIAFYRRMKKESFDILFCLQSNLRANLLYPFINATRKIGYKSFRAREGHKFFINEKISEDRDHLLEHYFCFLESIGVTKRKKPSLVVPQSTLKHSHQFVPQSRFVLLHPFASKPIRNWSMKRYRSLVQELVQRQEHVVVTGSKGQVWPYEIEGCTNLTGKIELLELAALIKRARLVIAPDTGPLHMADILGTKLIGLYAASNPLSSGPFYQSENVINKYPQALKKFHPNKSNPPLNFKVCKDGVMDLISLKQLLSIASKALNESTSQADQ